MNKFYHEFTPKFSGNYLWVVLILAIVIFYIGRSKVNRTSKEVVTPRYDLRIFEVFAAIFGNITALVLYREKSAGIMQVCMNSIADSDPIYGFICYGAGLFVLGLLMSGFYLGIAKAGVWVQYELYYRAIQNERKAHVEKKVFELNKIIAVQNLQKEELIVEDNFDIFFKKMA